MCCHLAKLPVAKQISGIAMFVLIFFAGCAVGIQCSGYILSIAARYTTRTFRLAGDEQSSETTFRWHGGRREGRSAVRQWPNLRVVYTNSDFGHSLSNNEGCVGASVRKNARMAATEPTAAGRESGGTKRPPPWDFKTYGLLFEKDAEEAEKLKSDLEE